ncbi:MAG: GNAT family N-acetyltransferase [Desulfobacterales bacterium]|jgi:hypothetical protein|nr:GNAT family N-acetyltransferase [Desulfobacterales bacterium]
MSRPSSLEMRWIPQIAAIDRDAWDRLAQPMQTPFLEWDWLWLMEASGSAAPQNGWAPRHLTVWSGGELIAAAPLYIKRHSAGEFVFDHAWAELAGRLGVSYYPKLVGMSPFTPLIGYRFLTAAGVDEQVLTGWMLNEIEEFCRRHQLAGASFLFSDPLWAESVSRRGYCPWVHPSFAWVNENFHDFNDYLARFNSNQRRNIRRERSRLRSQGISVDMIAGGHLQRSHYEVMYRYYARTNDQFGPWGCKYLTPEFFRLLPERFGHRLVFAVARSRASGGMPLAMSMCVAKGERLYGRYWGSLQKTDCLHFEACYYRPIEWAIAHGIRLFDPGAGGGHKLRRGFRLIANHSLHRFHHPALRRVMETHIEAINRSERDEISAINRELPLRRQTR